jgi:hypothetical protein
MNVGDRRRYESRMEQEIEQFAELEEIHDLPPIYHYWAERYIAPKLDAVGIGPFDTFLPGPIAERCMQDPTEMVEVVSVGTGNCDQECRLAASLVGQGIENFRIACLEVVRSPRRPHGVAIIPLSRYRGGLTHQKASCRGRGASQAWSSKPMTRNEV